MYSKDQQRWRYYDFIAKKQCVVPENIHTPTTEDSLICTPHPPGVSVPARVFDENETKTRFQLPYYTKLTLHKINVLEINANLMVNDFRTKKINAKEEVEFHNKGN